MERALAMQQNQFKKDSYNYFVISADVGASHTYVAIFGIKDKKKFDLVLKYTYNTKDVAYIYDALNLALKDAKELYDINVNRCCIGAAGPVSRKRGYIKMTNADLVIDQKDILAHTMLNKVLLVNDFEAIGYGLDMIDLKKDVTEISHVGEDLTGQWVSQNTYAVLGAGTGLGMTIAYYDSNRHLHIPLPSEGGHMDFVPYDALEMELAEYLKTKKLTKKNIHPEFERVLCGSGIVSIFDFLKAKTKPTKFSKEIDALTDDKKPEAIFKYYAQDPTCKKTIDLFVNFYGRAARILALMSECYSGLFIAGKLAQKNSSFFTDGKFMAEFEKHDKRNDILRKTKVYLIKNDDIGLLGCCNVAANFYNI